MNRTLTLLCLALAAPITACNGDKTLEGELKTCILSTDFPAGNCSLCGVASLDGEIVNTENFTVQKKDKKHGYDDYDDWAAESCTTFWPPGSVLEGQMLKAEDCEELGYTESDLFTFDTGEIERFNHDGSCTTFEDPAAATSR